jgi:DNA repair protein RadC
MNVCVAVKILRIEVLDHVIVTPFKLCSMKTLGHFST